MTRRRPPTSSATTRSTTTSRSIPSTGATRSATRSACSSGWPTRCGSTPLHIVADGPIVMTERIDHFAQGDRDIALPVMGTFEVRRRQDHRLARLLRHEPVHEPDVARVGRADARSRGKGRGRHRRRQRHRARVLPPLGRRRHRRARRRHPRGARREDRRRGRGDRGGAPRSRGSTRRTRATTTPWSPPRSRSWAASTCSSPRPASPTRTTGATTPLTRRSRGLQERASVGSGAAVRRHRARRLGARPRREPHRHVAVDAVDGAPDARAGTRWFDRHHLVDRGEASGTGRARVRRVEGGRVDAHAPRREDARRRRASG